MAKQVGAPRLPRARIGGSNAQTGGKRTRNAASGKGKTLTGDRGRAGDWAVFSRCPRRIPAKFNANGQATQERQDAMFDLVKESLDLMVVIGGYNSSNTTHLQEIAVERHIPSYHIDSASRLGPGNRIEHKLLHGAMTVTDGWLPDGPITVGVTSGASTPDRSVEETIEYIFAAKAAMATAAVV